MGYITPPVHFFFLFLSHIFKIYLSVISALSRIIFIGACNISASIRSINFPPHPLCYLSLLSVSMFVTRPQDLRCRGRNRNALISYSARVKERRQSDQSLTLYMYMCMYIHMYTSPIFSSSHRMISVFSSRSQ